MHILNIMRIKIFKLCILMLRHNKLIEQIDNEGWLYAGASTFYEQLLRRYFLAKKVIKQNCN